MAGPVGGWCCGGHCGAIAGGDAPFDADQVDEAGAPAGAGAPGLALGAAPAGPPGGGAGGGAGGGGERKRRPPHAPPRGGAGAGAGAEPGAPAAPAAPAALASPRAPAAAAWGAAEGAAFRPAFLAAPAAPPGAAFAAAPPPPVVGAGDVRLGGWLSEHSSGREESLAEGRVRKATARAAAVRAAAVRAAAAALARAGQAGAYRPTRSRTKRLLERIVNSRQTQLLLLAMSLLFCAGHVISLAEVDADIAKADWIAFSGAILIFVSLGEFLVLVTVQAGLCRFWHFFWPLFHKLMTVWLLMMLLAVGESTCVRLAKEHILFADAVLPKGNGDRYRITIAAVLMYRALRCWAIRYNISVERTLLARQRVMDEDASGIWGDEFARKRRELEKRRSTRLMALMDHPVTQTAIIGAVLFYCALYATTVSWSFLKNLSIPSHIYVLTRPMGYALVALFCFELTLRCLASEGERFFTPVWHKVEVFVLLLCLLNVGYVSWYSDALRSGEKRSKPQATLTGALLLLHRILRVVGLRYQVKATELDAGRLFSGLVSDWLRVNCGGVLDVPAKNIRLTIDHQVVKLVVYKARIKPEVLQELHLPVTLRGAYLEELEVVLPGLSTLLGKWVEGHGLLPKVPGTAAFAPGAAAPLKEGAGRSVLRMRGLVILLAPGPGLREAGVGAGVVAADSGEGRSTSGRASTGTRAPGAGAWTPAGSGWASPKAWTPAEMVRAASVASLWFGRTTSGVSSEPADDPAGDGGADYWKFGRVQESKSNLVGLLCSQFPWALEDSKEEMRPVVDRCLAHWELDVRAVRVQYVDPDGALGHGVAAASLSVGALWARCLAGAAAACDAARVRADVRLGADAASVASLPADDPRELTRRLRRESAADMLRAWAGEALARQGWRAAVPQERSFAGGQDAVLSVLWARLRAGAGGAAPAQPADEEDLDAYVGETPAEAADRQEGYPLLFARPRVRAPRGRRGRSPTRRADALEWRLQTHPVRLSVDGAQLRYLSTLADCVRLWALRDGAFRWRPGVAPGDASLEPADRGTVARLWWTYAAQRVLADLGRGGAGGAGGAACAWRAANRRQLAGVLAELAARRGGLLPAWELRWQKELQVQLPLEDVLQCHARAFLGKEGGRELGGTSDVDWAQHFAGCWRVFVPVVDARIFSAPPACTRLGSGAQRPLCRLRLEALAVVAQVPRAVSEMLTVQMSLGDASVTCPAAGHYTLGFSNCICWVDRPLACDAQAAPGPAPRGGGRAPPAAARRACLEARAAVAPREHGGAHRLGHVDLRVADFRAVLHEPLVLELAQLFQAQGAGPGTSRAEPACAEGVRRLPRGASRLLGVRPPGAGDARVGAAPGAAAGATAPRLARRARPAAGAPLVVAGGRLVGPLAEAFEVPSDDLADATGGQRELPARAAVLRAARAAREALEADRRLFEAVARLGGGAGGQSIAWAMDVEIGAFCLTQVGEYSQASLLVEDFQLGPVQARGRWRPGGAGFVWSQAWSTDDGADVTGLHMHRSLAPLDAPGSAGGGETPSPGAASTPADRAGVEAGEESGSLATSEAEGEERRRLVVEDEVAPFIPCADAAHPGGELGPVIPGIRAFAPRPAQSTRTPCTVHKLCTTPHGTSPYGTSRGTARAPPRGTHGALLPACGKAPLSVSVRVVPRTHPAICPRNSPSGG